MENSVHPRILIFSVIIGALLLFFVIGAFVSAKNRTGTIVLPGGITYLGSTPTKSEERWNIQKGTIFPYSFSYPSSFSLGVFPDDPYDSVTAFITGSDSNTNIFFRVENLTTLKKTPYAGNIEEYAKIWWKDYAWKGVSSVTPFTNKNGLKGYRALYVNNLGKTPYEHVFIEIPENPDLVIWISGKLFTPNVFDKLINSVSWK